MNYLRGKEKNIVLFSRTNIIWLLNSKKQTEQILKDSSGQKTTTYDAEQTLMLTPLDSGSLYRPRRKKTFRHRSGLSGARQAAPHRDPTGPTRLRASAESRPLEVWELGYKRDTF